MNDQELKRMLELAMSNRPAPSAPTVEPTETAILRTAWKQLSADLTEADKQDNSDAAHFLERLERSACHRHSVAPSAAETIASASTNRAAIVTCSHHTDEPVGVKGWLALVLSVAICGSAILWYDFDREPGNAQVVSAESTAEMDEPAAGGSVSERHATVAKSDIPPSEQIESVPGTYAEWTDAVDQAIAQATWQIASMQSTSRWDQSLEALAHYRDSVEQEMNEWDL